MIAGCLTGAARAAVADPHAPDQQAADPSAIGATLDDGIERYRAGAPLHALEVFVQVAQADPAAALPWIWAGISATAGGKMQDAETYFERALRRGHTPFQERIVHGWLARLAMLREPVHAEALPVISAAARAVAALARSTNPRLTPREAGWLGDRLVAAARHNGLDPWMLAAVVYVESRFDQTLISSRGARGLGQLMPQTARAAGVNPLDPWGNLLGTAMTLSSCHREFHDWRLALAAYNAGSAAVYRYRGIPPFAETRWYVAAVLAVYRKIHPG